MKAVEVLKISGELLKVMSENDIARDDWQYVGMYEEFLHRRAMRQGVKRIVRELAERYGVSVRTVERVRKRLRKFDGLGATSGHRGPRVAACDGRRAQVVRRGEHRRAASIHAGVSCKADGHGCEDDGMPVLRK